MKVTMSLSSVVDAGGYWEVKVKNVEEVFGSLIDQLEDAEPLQDLHVTLGYDASNPEYSHKPNPAAVFNGTIRGYALFGENNDILVLTLDSADLEIEHERIHADGAKFDFNPYRPHITLKKNATEEDIQKVDDWLLENEGLILQFHGERQEMLE